MPGVCERVGLVDPMFDRLTCPVSSLVNCKFSPFSQTVPSSVVWQNSFSNAQSKSFIDKVYKHKIMQEKY